jgi:hypothetical protein
MIAGVVLLNIYGDNLIPAIAPYIRIL